MSDNFQIKKLRGSGGYVLALVTDEQQSKGNLGGPDLFSASNLPIGAKNRSGPPRFPFLCCSSVTSASTYPPEPLNFFIWKLSLMYEDNKNIT